jgi:hypothetical protein
MIHIGQKAWRNPKQVRKTWWKYLSIPIMKPRFPACSSVVMLLNFTFNVRLLKIIYCNGFIQSIKLCSQENPFLGKHIPEATQTTMELRLLCSERFNKQVFVTINFHEYELAYTYKEPWTLFIHSATSRSHINHENANVRNIGQGGLRHRKYKRLKLGGGQIYDRSID